MKIEYHNLYTHFILITQNRLPLITQSHRERIEKYITGVVNNNHSKLYSIYANPEHVHILVSRFPRLSEEVLLTIIAEMLRDSLLKTSFAEEYDQFLKHYQQTLKWEIR